MSHPRTIMTVVLLSAGCGTTASPRSAPTGSAAAAEVPVTQVAGTTQAVASTVVAAPPATPVAPATPPPIADDSAQPPARLELRGELYNTNPEAARAQLAHFRPLCDADGYPLVGNVANKGVRYEVADFCADLRAPRPSGS